MKSLAHTGDSGEEHARRLSVRSRLIPRVGAAAVLPVVLGLFVVVGCTSSDSTATGEATADTARSAAAAAADTSTDTLSLDSLLPRRRATPITGATGTARTVRSRRSATTWRASTSPTVRTSAGRRGSPSRRPGA